LSGEGRDGIGGGRSGAARACFALAAMLLVLTMSPASSADAGQQTWTIMVYMAADVSPELPWELDIGEMEASNLPDEVTVVVLVDPPDAPNSMLLEIANDPDGLDLSIISPHIDDEGAVVPLSGEVNTGSPAVLSDFIVFCAERYPSDRHVLVLWGHGAQWRGLCPDGTDLLTLPELGDALDDAYQRVGRGLDIVAVDACAEASLEMALQVGGNADLFVGSETNVPSEGLPYVTVLGGLASDTGQTPRELASLIVDSYIQWATFAAYDDVDMEVLDLSRCDAVAESLDRVSSECVIYSQLYRDELLDAATGSELEGEYWTLDFGGLMSNLASLDLPAEVAAAAVDAALEYGAMRLYSGSNRDETDGLGQLSGASIYVPSPEMLDQGYSGLRIASTEWHAFSLLLRGDPVPFEPTPDPSVSYQDADADGLHDALILSWQDGLPSGATVMAAVYSDRNGSLMNLGAFTSSDPMVEIAGMYGTLLVSARVTVDGFASSHSHLSATLHGQVRIRLQLYGDGLIHGRPLDILVLSADSVARVTVESDSMQFGVMVPEFAANGEVVEVRAVDRGGDRALSSASVALDGTDIRLSLFVPEPTDEGFSVDVNALVLLALTALPAAVAAAIFAHGRLKNRK
jgi:hypothetical protein